jgi:hypothetical protein
VTLHEEATTADAVGRPLDLRVGRLVPKRVMPSEVHLDDAGRPICMYCDKPLRKATASAFWRYDASVVQLYGWLGCCNFCSERCAARWGVVKASSTCAD